LQQEWQFLQRITNGLSLECEGIAQALQWDFLPALFGNGLVNDDFPRQLASCLPVKRADLAILDPTVGVESNGIHNSFIIGVHTFLCKKFPNPRKITTKYLATTMASRQIKTKYLATTMHLAK
jgi:hypothetical protein